MVFFGIIFNHGLPIIHFVFIHNLLFRSTTLLFWSIVGAGFIPAHFWTTILSVFLFTVGAGLAPALSWVTMFSGATARVAPTLCKFSFFTRSLLFLIYFLQALPLPNRPLFFLLRSIRGHQRQCHREIFYLAMDLAPAHEWAYWGQNRVR